MGKRIKDELTCYKPNFWFALGAHPRTLADFLGRAENGRLRGFVAFLDKSEVMSVSFEDKLVAHRHSMQLLRDTSEYVVRTQHTEAGLHEIQYTPDAMMIVAAMHEAARKVSKQVNDGDPAPANTFWPALVKFVGKAHASITFTNVLTRLAIWHSSLARRSQN